MKNNRKNGVIVSTETKQEVIDSATSFLEDMIILWNQRFPEQIISREEIINKLNENGKI